MNDLIHRQIAIDALNKWEREYEWDAWCDENIDAIRDQFLTPANVIEKLPSAQPELPKDIIEYAKINYVLGHTDGYKQGMRDAEPSWIPCSERLPEESDGTVLVCFPDEFPYSNKEPYINAKHNQRVKTAFYSQFNKTWYIGDFGGIGKVRPIAWMPLPEPYQAESEDEE